jgi:hypothetical protein
MNFEEFKSSFEKENRKLKLALAISLIIFSIGTITQLLARKYYVYKGGEIFKERPLIEEVCRQSFLTLAKGDPNPHVVSSEIIDLAIKESFSLIVEDILQVTSLETGVCKLVVKSNEKLLAFRLSMKMDQDNPFYYKLIQLDEVASSEGKI